MNWAAIKTKIIDFVVAKAKAYFSKDLAKRAAKFLILKVIGLSGGPLSAIGIWLTTKAVNWGFLEAKEVIQHIKDNNTIKDGDALEALPATDEIKRKRKENLKKLLEG